MASIDLCVRGAGIFGLSIAWTALRRGARVRVIDPFGPAAGSSGGIVGALAPHVPENWNPKKAFQLESLLMAEEFWADVAAGGGGDAGYLRSGRVQPLRDAEAVALAKARRETAKALWGDKATWDVVPIGRDLWAPRSTTGLVIRDTLSAVIHPRKACSALLQALARHGVTVEPEGETDAPTIWATGVQGLEELSLGHSRSLGTAVKGQAALLQHNARGMSQIFVDGVHIIPHSDGTVAIGSTSETSFDDPTGTDAQLDDVIATARASVVMLRDAPVIDRWAGLRPRSRSRAPMLGPWPDRPDYYIANGGFKIGFGMAPKVAQVMADLVLEGADHIPDGFRVEDNF
ncbi:MAG: FAD-dependent oxidoreductase [Pseudomonadota bacterium]